MKRWLVDYELTLHGITEVEAETAEEAIALVNAGHFAAHPGEERVDWGALGRAREVDGGYHHQ